MKKFLIILLTICMVFALCACGISATDGNGNMTVIGTAVEQGIILTVRVLESVILIVGTWLLGKLGSKVGLQNIKGALDNLFNITRQTTSELQQVIVDNWKATNGGKLTDEQIAILREQLLALVKKKLDKPTRELIVAAGADLNALISGEAESWIKSLK